MTSASWLATGTGIPDDGVAIEVTYETGNQSSWHHIPTLGPILQPVLGGELFEGSLNFRADTPMAFPDPAIVSAVENEWLLAPVVIADDAVGIAARRADSGDIDFIEVFAREKLAPRLRLTPGCRVELRFLSGGHLGLAV